MGEELEDAQADLRAIHALASAVLAKNPTVESALQVVSDFDRERERTETGPKDGWELLQRATALLGAMCEHDNPGSEKVYCSLSDFLRDAGHEYEYEGMRYVQMLDTVKAMNSRTVAGKKS